MNTTFARFKLFRMPNHLFGCVYCGNPADTKDHVSPRSLHRHLEMFDASTLEDDIAGALVPACRECNCILGNNPSWLLSNRIKACKQKFFRRHYKALTRVIWDEDEIEECGRSLRSAISAMNRGDLELRARYAFKAPIDFVQEVELYQLGVDLRIRAIPESRR